MTGPAACSRTPGIDGLTGLGPDHQGKSEREVLQTGPRDSSQLVSPKSIFGIPKSV